MATSKFQILQTLIALPAKCSSCGGITGPFLDTAFSAEEYGAVVFCIPCISEMGRVAGLVDPTPPVEPVAELTREELDEYYASFGTLLAEFERSTLRLLPINTSPSEPESEPAPSERAGANGQDGDSAVSKKSIGVSNSSSSSPAFTLE